MPDAVVRFGDDELNLPAHVGTQGDYAIDISALRGALGIVTLDRGFANTAEGRSSVSFIDGEEGVLLYRGYPIEQLAEQARFLEVAYLLQYGELPTKSELEQYEESITRHTLLREDMKHLFEAFPHSAHPMQILASATSALATYYPDALNPLDPEAVDISCRRLVAKAPTMVAWSYKYRTHQPYVYPANDLGYSENFLRMMFAVPAEDYVVDPVVATTLNLLLVLHADHGQNCSSSAVRLVGSGHANIFSSVAAGIHALSGPLHGGANQEVLEMLEWIVAEGLDLDTVVRKAKDRNDPFRLMGFGHRVYKNFDPRARILKKAAADVLHALGVDDPLLDLAMRLEEVALSDDYFVERKLYPNVDFYSGIIYRAMGFPIDMFTVLFAMGRLPGWISQFRELLADPETRIFRPRQLYIGSPVRDFVAMDER
ncbi:MAG: citrate synthase [Actinobacteria bacterium]|nr:citrate synthase [Actinomycetota bacterium]MCI0542932.1 citrate synthase [Actinomycetota bacterium]MCI0679602.1 citrate synthase [Actinomycetota bacterium]